MVIEEAGWSPSRRAQATFKRPNNLAGDPAVVLFTIESFRVDRLLKSLPTKSSQLSLGT